MIIKTIVAFLFFILETYGNNYELESYFQNFTTIKSPFQLRDPFRPLDLKMSINESKEKRSGIFYSKNNDFLPIDKIVVVGVVHGKRKRAMLKRPSGDIIIVKEGSMLNNKMAEVKSIREQGIVILEKIKNIYGQEEYIETILPIDPK